MPASASKPPHWSSDCISRPWSKRTIFWHAWRAISQIGERAAASVLAGALGEILANLPGYQPAAAPGKVLTMTEALPWWRRLKAKAKPVARAPVVVPTERLLQGEADG